jgi:hypothetical protein
LTPDKLRKAYQVGVDSLMYHNARSAKHQIQNGAKRTHALKWVVKRTHVFKWVVKRTHVFLNGL